MNLLSNQYFNSNAAKVGPVQYPKNTNMPHLMNSKSLAKSDLDVTRASPCERNTNDTQRDSQKSASPDRSSDESNGSGSKDSIFVICEICDGYIKDLIQLRTHMQSVHKVSKVRC